MLRSLFLLITFFFVSAGQAQSPIRYSGYHQTLRIEDADEVSWEREARWELIDKAQVADFEIRLPLPPQVELEEAEVFVYNQLGEEIAYFEAADFRLHNLAGESEFLQSPELVLSPVINTYPIKVSLRLRMSSEQSMLLPAFEPISQYNQAVDSARFTLLVDPDLKVNFRDNDMGKMQTGQEDGLDRFYWERIKPGAAPFKREVYAPEFRDRVPYVQVALENFEYQQEEGSMRDWRSLGNFLRPFMSLPEPEFIPELLDDIGYEVDSNAGDVKNVLSLYHWILDDYQYLDLPLNTTGFKPLPLADLWTEEKGDALSLSFLLKATLQRYGIEAHYALVHKAKASIATDFVYQAFDHVVLIVPTDEGDLICDFSTAEEPGFHFHPKYQGDHWLELDPGGANLRSMPEKAERSESMQSLTSLDSAGTEKWYRYSLRIEKALAPQLALLDALGVTEQDRYLNKLIAVNYQIKDIQIESNETADKAQLRARLELDGVFKQNGNRFFLNTRMLQGLFPQLPPDTARQSPIDIEALHQTSYDIYLNLPSGYLLDELPLSQTAQSRYGTATLNYAIKKEVHQLHIHFEGSFHKGLYGQEEYQALRNFIKEVNQLAEPNLILKPAE